MCCCVYVFCCLFLLFCCSLHLQSLFIYLIILFSIFSCLYLSICLAFLHYHCVYFPRLCLFKLFWFQLFMYCSCFYFSIEFSDPIGFQVSFFFLISDSLLFIYSDFYEDVVSSVLFISIVIVRLLVYMILIYYPVSQWFLRFLVVIYIQFAYLT